MMISMMDITLSPAIKILSIAEITKTCLHIKVILKRYEDYLNGTLGSGSELSEDNVSSNVIVPVIG